MNSKTLITGPKAWFLLTIILFLAELLYLIPMLLLVLYASICCVGYDAGIRAASLMFAISRPPVLIMEAVVLLVGPFVAWISFHKNQANKWPRFISAVIGAQFIVVLVGMVFAIWRA